MKVFRRIIKGIQLKGETSDPTDNLEGSVFHNSTSNRIKMYLEAAIRTLVSEDQTQTLTNKTIDGDDNTVQDLALTSLKTELADASKFIERDALGVPVSGKTVPGGDVVGTTDTQTLTNKTIDADSNTITNIEDADIKAAAAIDATKIADGSVTSAEFQFINSVTSNVQTQLDSKADISGGTDNRLVRTDGTDNIQQSGITVDDTDNVTGVNDLTIDGNLTVNGTTTTVNTATLDVTDTNITVNDTGNDASAEGAGLTVERTGTDGSLVYEDALVSKWKAGSVGSEIEMMNVSSAQTVTNKDMSNANNNVDTASADSFTRNTGNQSVITIPDAASADNFVLEAQAQVLTNKDIDGGTASNTSRFTIPKDTKANLDALTRKEGTVVFATDLDKYFGDDGTNLVELGSTSPGLINYVSNPDAEVNVDGWATYDDTNSTPTDLTGGTATVVSVARTTSAGEVQRGVGSFKLAKTAADGTGEGVSHDLDKVDKIDQGKTLKISFDYETSANYVSGDIKMYAYDIDGALIGAIRNDDSGDLLEAPNGGTFQGEFDSVAGNDDYRIGFHVATTNALAYDVFYDNVRVSADNFTPTAIMTNWESFTPTGSWTTNTTYSGHKRRVGDSMEVIVRLDLAGAPTAGSLTIDIPDGLSIDLTKFEDGASNEIASGEVIVTNSGVAALFGNMRYSATATELEVMYYNDNSTEETFINVTNTAPFTFGTSDSVWCRFSVPIEGWSAGNLISTNETNLSTLKLRVSRSSDQSIIDTTINTIEFNQFDFSTHGTDASLYDTATGIFTSPKSQYYKITIMANSRNVTVNNQTILYMFKEGVEAARMRQSDGGSTSFSNIVSDTVFLDKGDTLSGRVSNGDGSYALAGTASGALTYMTIEAVPDFSIFGVNGETEYIESKAQPASAWPITAAQFGDITSIELTPGEWDLSAIVMERNAGLPGGDRVFDIGISTTAGNSSTGLLEGDNNSEMPIRNISGFRFTQTIPSYRVIVTETTTFYLKGRIDVLTNINLQGYRLSARRVK